ncbi:SDR family NAD(P)-dependent oxidoreductase [Halocatena pleomorpha]|uniref:SDR family NAD(P)-dependent oxidoreductase n=1 Tax=Halocatena pleomorpha TaxID=1785090 RepID=A0A3P3RKI9_9EURY|nr:SDR family NAD(P)-dependent oxidoreductase [Halocatena pleomorpha]RRJ34056.1 SDR family NAD(P)-dependent oxidoreductase [Halocatena pleomorpha]
MSEQRGPTNSVDNVPNTSHGIGTVVVTGANSGLGFEVTKALAKEGAHTIMAWREHKKETETEFSGASPTVHNLDLADSDTAWILSRPFRRCKGVDPLSSGACRGVRLRCDLDSD